MTNKSKYVGCRRIAKNPRGSKISFYYVAGEGVGVDTVVKSEQLKGTSLYSEGYRGYWYLNVDTLKKSYAYEPLRRFVCEDKNIDIYVEVSKAGDSVSFRSDKDGDNISIIYYAVGYSYDVGISDGLQEHVSMTLTKKQFRNAIKMALNL